MRPTHSTLRQLLIVAGLAVVPAFAAAADLDNLVKNSPFGEGKGTPLAEKPSNLEFRGMYVDHGVTYFSIYNTTTKLSAWVAQGEAPQGLVPVSVKSYDAETDSIVLENAGQPVKLSLKQAVIGTAPAAPAPQATTLNMATDAQPQGGFGGGFGRGGFNNGQPPTPEQIAAFREQMKQRGMDRQQNGGGEAGAANTDNGGGKRDRGNFTRGGEAGATSNAAPTNGGNFGGKGGRTRGN
jgi:hypothetical protein